MLRGKAQAKVKGFMRGAGVNSRMGIGKQTEAG